MPVTRLREHLAWLRRERYAIVPLATLIDELKQGGPLHGRGVTITIDDGYEEVADLAAPILAEFDAPATTFIVSGFQDGHCWLWWDQLEYLMSRAPVRRLELDLPGETLRLVWEDPPGAVRAASQLAERLQWVPDQLRRDTLTGLGRRFGVELPASAPSGFRPMSWDAVRRCAGSGMSFGPHTVTHPILAAVSADQAEIEIAQSWFRLRQETSATVPVFCFPNGAPAAQLRWHAQLLRRIGLQAAVTTVPGYPSHPGKRLLAAEEVPYFLPRFAWPESLPELAELTSGVWRLRKVLRGAPPPPYRL
jgi:peptidoglycan/xylan/chitin deacetylase (PgdA/CDA1 family)